MKDEQENADLAFLNRYTDFATAAKAIRQEIEAEDEQVERARIAKENKAIFFYRGLSSGLEVEGEFVPLDLESVGSPREAAILLSDNVIRPQVRALAKEWSRSRTMLNVRPRSLTWKHQAGARWADAAIKFAQERIQNETFRQREGKFSILTGNFFRHSFFEKGGRRSPVVKIPIYSTQQIDPGHLECPTCLYATELDDVEQNEAMQYDCPECGGDMRQTEPQYAQVPTGEKKVPVGDVQTILVDTRTVKIPRSTRRMEDHSYLRWKEITEWMTAQRRYRHVQIRPGINSQEGRSVIDSESITGAHEYAAVVSSDAVTESRVEIDHVWVTPDRYWFLEFEEDQDIFGFTIKADIPMDEQFPNGLLLEFINEELVSVEESDFRDCWVHGTYDELFESPYGDGIDDAMADQQRINEITSAQMENVLFQTFGKIIVNPKGIDPSKLENDSSIVPMNDNINTDIEPRKLFDVIDPPRLNEDTWEVRGQVERQMREKTGAYLTLTGENDPATGTATETAIMRDAAVAMLGLPLALRSQADVEWAYQVLELYQKNWVDEYHKTMLGGYSVQEAEAFRELDIRNDLRITISNNSWIPRTEDEERQDFLAYLTAGGIPLGFANPSIPLPIRKIAAEVFRPNMELDTIQPDIRIAETRIAQLLKAGEELPSPAELTPGEDDPEEIEIAHQQAALILAGQIPVRLKVDDHAIFIDVYRNFLKRDEGLNAHPIVQEAVEVLIERHEDALAQLSMMATAQAASEAAMTQPAQGGEEKPPQGSGRETQPNGVSPDLPTAPTAMAQAQPVIPA